LKNKKIYKDAKRLENGRCEQQMCKKLEDQQMCKEIGEQQMCKMLKDWLMCKEIEEQENVQRCKEQSRQWTADVQRA
jgi:ethanolamine utilization protein EutQ (cupin superfamily)